MLKQKYFLFRLCYDVTCNDVSAQRQLIDILSRMAANWERDSIYSLYYQMVIVACIIWHFGMEIKPLSLFSNHEVTSFFQTGPTNEISKMPLSGWLRDGSINQSRSVRNARKRFLELSTEGTVANIHVMNDMGDLDKTNYRFVQFKISLIPFLFGILFLFSIWAFTFLFYLYFCFRFLFGLLFPFSN